MWPPEGGWWGVTGATQSNVSRRLSFPDCAPSMDYMEQSKQIRRLAREAYVAALRDGRKVRAATFKDRKKEAARKACRGRNHQ